MKIKMKIFISFVLLLSVLVACNRKSVPVSSIGRQNKVYNEAVFNQLYVEAIKQKLLGNGGDALNFLEQCLKVDPINDAVYYQMAQIVLANGDMKNGKKYSLKAVSLDEKNLWYLMMAAGIYYQEKNLDSALIFYEKAVKNFPDNEKLELTLGNLYSENGNFKEAILIFDNFDRKYGVNEESTVSSVRNLIASGRFDDALIKARLLLEQKPEEILYNGLLAEIYRGKGEKEKAQDVYDKLMERNPGNPQIQLSLCDFLITEKNYDELFVFLGTVILNKNIKREEKISLLAGIIELHDLDKDKQDKLMLSLMILEANYKGDDVIPILRPELLIRQQRLAEAAGLLEEIIKANSNNYYAFEKLLLVYLQEGDYAQLTKRGEECASRFNMSFLAKILYATGATESKKFDIALEELRKAEILAGDNKEYLLQVLTLRADVYYRMKDFDKSFQIFEEALKFNTDDLTLINNYAYYLAEQGMKLKEAEDMAGRVIKKEPNNTTYLDTYAWVLYKRGKLKDASRIMEQIINSGEKPDAEWFEHYGYILAKQKKCPEAVIMWNTALKLDSTKTHLAKEIEDCKR